MFIEAHVKSDNRMFDNQKLANWGSPVLTLLYVKQHKRNLLYPFYV